MENTKPTPIDLEKYVTHTKKCNARMFYMKNDKVVEDSFGKCDCGLHELLDALGLRKRKQMEYY